MIKPVKRLFSLFVSVVILAGMVVSVPGFGFQDAYALTTTVDDIPGASINIPDPGVGLSCTTTITRTINVASNLIISDINVGVNVSHLRRSDVRVTLTSPGGTTVVLISGAGLGSPVIASPDDYDNYDVMLDDSSINSLYDNDNDIVAAAFYDRTARPNEALSQFKGEDAFGNWTLTICDTRNTEIGTYNRAQLVINSSDPNSVAGIVFTDYTDNGIRNQGDTGVSGVVVTAFNNAGAIVDTDTTDSAGLYSLNIPNGTKVRIEFSNIPANLRPGAFGKDSGTTVQFVTAPAAGIDLGLAKPDEYCNDNPWLVSTCYINGNPLGGGSAGTARVLLSIPYDAYGRLDNSLENPLATGAQIGTTWGLAFQRSTGTIFAGALAKRHAGLGPLGAGGIYAVQMDQTTGAAISVSNFVDITTIGIPNVGTLGSNAARGLPAVSATPNTDSNAWDAVGKSAIGDMDMSTDDTTIWMINLANQTLYSVFIGTPPTTPTSGDVSSFPVVLPVGATACPASDVRPWAVEVYRGDVYIGVVCSAESTQNVNNLRAYVIRMNEAAPGAFTLVTEFSLNYPRGIASSSDGGYPAEWRPWSPAMTSLCNAPCASQFDLAFDKQIIYPQPVLSDIEFDTNGDMILGFMDRTGHQTGNANFATSNPWDDNPGNPAIGVTLYDRATYAQVNVINLPVGTLYEGVSAGDTLRLCNVGGVFALETNATCGGNTTGGANGIPGQGPGGGEYYWQDMFPVSTNRDSGTHHEITLGGLLLVPGTNEVAVSVFDPFDLRAGGVAWFNNITGVRTRAYEVFGIDQGGGATTFGKAAGLGDIEGFCFNAPIEIGNRVWFDTDKDGVQDAEEIPLAGVIVELYDQQGNLIASVVTDANGNYYFSSGPGTDSSFQDYAIDALNPNSQYEVRIPLNQPALATYTLTQNDSVPEDLRDSDGIPIGGAAVATVTTGDPGDNDHTFDFGFNVGGNPTPTPTSPPGGGGTSTPTPIAGGFLIPITGFAPDSVTPLDVATRPSYAPTTLAMEIPAIKVNTSILSVAKKNGSWDVSWLQDQAGWLEGTAYPTWSGNSVLTAHVVNADGKPGLFSRLKYLNSGEYIFVYNSGYRYIYKVVSNKSVMPNDISVIQHEEKSYLTLVTCDMYDLKTNTYLRRVVVRAVLVDVSFNR